jgi:proton-coupled amino acid transporter
MISLGVLLGYALQFYVAIQIMWPNVYDRFKMAQNHPAIAEVLFRILLVVVTFLVAELVPQLNLFISLIGALCSTALALVFPPVIQLILEMGGDGGPSVFVCLKNGFILILALLGFLTGSYESLNNIVQTFFR